MQIHGSVKDGAFSNLRHFFLVIKSFEGKQVTISVKRREIKRTPQQNKYLWKVVYGIISDYTGYSPDQLHYEVEDFLKLRTEIDDNGLSKIIPTSEMDAERFWRYVDDCRQLAADKLSLYIPDPE